MAEAATHKSLLQEALIGVTYEDKMQLKKKGINIRSFNHRQLDEFIDLTNHMWDPVAAAQHVQNMDHDDYELVEDYTTEYEDEVTLDDEDMTEILELLGTSLDD